MRTWSTDELPAGEQFSYWRDVICEAFTPLSPRRRAETSAGGLRGWVRSSPLSSTNCAAIGSTAQKHVHGAAEVRRTPADSVFVNLVLSGVCVGEQRGRTCELRAGEFGMFDATEPFSLDYVEDWEVLSFRVPREKLLPLLARPEGATAVTHSGARPSTAAVIAMMRTVWQTVDGLDVPTATAMDDAFASVLAAAVGGSPDVRPQCRADAEAALRGAINRHILASLRWGDLSAAAVAARFEISVRKLHALYEDHALTYGQQVRRMRVEACARDVADAGRGTSLTAIAARWGFSDLSHLNRVFRAELGCSPSEYRASRRTGAAVPGGGPPATATRRRGHR
ncbi:helix-turn-helix domain-containing protein [Pseudonocardia petroleophila]|uniref:Helix-turn-helix domain-containing protein n=1 Tax=Pseudonocardia petroleophila TaxID=37331 RepID=A0A7G7MIL6_9PSEU|nr:helix-turn-helix domain-containing protein [Pseudonocardia petroleophila]QNG52627.1 helix-turn-helix domain-containing protein [Pseudonocardia petroleophila]